MSYVEKKKVTFLLAHIQIIQNNIAHCQRLLIYIAIKRGIALIKYGTAENSICIHCV